MKKIHFSWRRGSKDSRGQGFKCLFSKDFISAFNISLESLNPRSLVPSGIIYAQLEIKVYSALNNYN